jgi:hypothetical protein
MQEEGGGEGGGGGSCIVCTKIKSELQLLVWTLIVSIDQNPSDALELRC